MNSLRLFSCFISVLAFYAAFGGEAPTAPEHDAFLYHLRTTVNSVNSEAEGLSADRKPVRVVMPVPYGR
jgi:hypothetical protein